MRLTERETEFRFRLGALVAIGLSAMIALWFSFYGWVWFVAITVKKAMALGWLP